MLHHTNDKHILSITNSIYFSFDGTFQEVGTLAGTPTWDGDRLADLKRELAVLLPARRAANIPPALATRSV